MTTDSNYDPLDPDDVAVNNTDDDAATLSIDNVTNTEGNSGTIDYIFTITHSGAEVVGGYGVTFFTANVEARAPSDYTANGGRIDFTTGAIGETQNITISVNGDTAVEINETFNVVLNSVIAPGKNITIDPAGKTGVGTIINDDSTTLSIADAMITEGNSGTSILTFTVELSGEVEDGLNVDYTTVDNTATATNSDYVSRTGTLTFEGLANEQEIIEITINGDDIVELDEFFFVNLSNIVPVSAPGASITFSDDSAIGTITNDDSAIISITGFSVNENVGTADFTIATDQPIQNEITLEFATSNISAIAGADYTAVGSTTLTFGGTNLDSQTVNIPITNDNIIEPTETLNGTINNLVTNGQNITLTGNVTDISAIGEIIDNDTATLSIDDVSVNEADGIATFTVTLTGNVQNNFTLDYSTADNTAIATSDYTAIPTTTLTFGGANSNTQTFNVTILENTIAEPTETYFINLTNLVTNGQTGISIADNQGEGEILDNDALELSIAGFTSTETETTQTANFTVTSNIAAEEDIVFTLTTTDATAIDGNDYTTQVAQSYTLLAGDTAINLPVDILGDVVVEPTETFTGTIAVTNANAQQVSITTDTATGTINDNDGSIVSIFSTIEPSEPSTNGLFTFNLSNPVSSPTVITYAVTGTAIAGIDFSSLTGSLTIPTGITTATIGIDILDDLILEEPETIIITITGTDNAVLIGVEDEAFVTITDDDSSEASIVATIEAAEPNTDGAFVVNLSNPVSIPTVINYQVSGTATATEDYVALTGSITIPADVTSGIINIPVLDDTDVEGTESVIISLVGTDNEVTISSTDQDMITIADNDVAEINIQVLTNAGEPSTNGQFEITLDQPVTVDTTVSYTVQGEATPGSDYVELSRTIVVPANTTSVIIPIEVLDDDIVEFNGETLIITLENVEDVLVIGTQNEATMIIQDDEIPQPSLELIKIADLQGTGDVGDSITYTFTIINTGNVAVDFIEINDPLLNASPIPVAGILARGEQTTITRAYQITQNDVDAGNVTNTAFVFGVDTVINTTVDDISDNGIEADGDDNPTIVELLQTPSIALVKTSRFNDENGDNVSQIGETISYSFTVTNTGNVTLFDIQIEDNLPGLTLSGEPIILEPGESDELNFTGTYAITVDDISNQLVVNQATVFGTTGLGVTVQDLSDGLDNFGDNPTETPLRGCELVVYNAISPDENGSNDYFMIEGIECYPDNKVQIFNRWGQIVYEKEQYDNRDNVFRGFSEVKGTIKGTDGLQAGTYFYIIQYTDFDGQTRALSGYLYLTGR